MKSTLLIGDCREKLKELPDNSIDCVVTSPPYWGLRDYKTEPIDFGDGYIGQLGLEPDPNLYIKHLTDIFDQVKRVLKPSGTCWVNLGDSYSTGGGSTNKDFNERWSGDKAGQRKQEIEKPKMNTDMPDKCLVQIPSRFALEMTSRGWILRNEIIWHKPNCMPSSVTDRFTVDFEKVFFFVKSKRYYFKQQYEAQIWTGQSGNKNYRPNVGFADEGMNSNGANPNGRNKRTVWTISTKPYSGSHFAVFPIDLIAPMIDAGCPKEICPKCGHIREPMTVVVGNTVTDAMRVAGCDDNGDYNGAGTKEYESNGVQNPSDVKRRILKSMSEVKRTEWTDCGCNAGWEPGTVLDIFSGSGTVLEYARKNGLNGIGIELNPDYKDLAVDRALLNIPPITNYGEAIDESQN